jgi:DNA invertase Pin-like site-specific DNA recombinase
MAIYGYVRATSVEKIRSQKLRLDAEGCTKVYADKIGSVRSKRPSLNRLVRRLTAGDVVLVERLRCLAYSTPDLIAVLNSIHKKGAAFRSVFEEWCDTTTHPNEVILSTFRGLSNFESQLASDRIKRRGPRPRLTLRQREEAIAQRTAGVSLRTIGRAYGVSHSTISRL